MDKDEYEKKLNAMSFNLVKHASNLKLKDVQDFEKAYNYYQEKWGKEDAERTKKTLKHIKYLKSMCKG